jgi:hypothetical protein
MALAQLVPESIPWRGALQLVIESVDVGLEVVDEEVDLSKDHDLLVVPSDPNLLAPVVAAVELIVHGTISSSSDLRTGLRPG